MGKEAGEGGERKETEVSKRVAKHEKMETTSKQRTDHDRQCGEGMHVQQVHVQKVRTCE